METAEADMKLHIAWLAILCLGLAAIPAWASQYDNDPINGTTDAWTTYLGYIVSDPITAGASTASFPYGVWYGDPDPDLEQLTWKFKCCGAIAGPAYDLVVIWSTQIYTFSWGAPTGVECAASQTGDTTILLCPGGIAAGQIVDEVAHSTTDDTVIYPLTWAWSAKGQPPQ